MLDQDKNFNLISLINLITCWLDNLWIFWGEVTCLLLLVVKVLSFLYWLIHYMSHTNFTSDEWFYFFLLFLVPWHNLFQENKVCTLFTCCSAEDVTSMIALCMVSRADLHCCNSCYYMARQSWGKLDHSGPFYWNVITGSHVFLFGKATNSK